jgi:hypothetical protein
MAHPIGNGTFSVCIAQHEASLWKREKKISVFERNGGIAGKHFWVGIRHLQGIERGVPRAARQSGGLQQTKHYGDKKATCKKSYQSMRRQRFNIESLRHKKGCDKGKRGKEVSVRGTLYRPRFRAVNIFGFAVVLRDVFIHRDITKIG